MPISRPGYQYQNLRQTLVSEIAAGVFPVGRRFPTDRELCARFGVSRHTVREALRELQHQGILARHRGVGTVVRARPGSFYTQTIGDISELGLYAAEAPLEGRSEQVITARPVLAEMLGCESEARWLHICGVRRLKGAAQPLCWTDILLSERFIAARDALREGDGPYYQKLERLCGISIRAVEQRITASAIAPDIAEILACTAGSPALQVRRRYFGEDGDAPFEISMSIYPADRFAYTARLSRETGARREHDAA